MNSQGGSEAKSLTNHKTRLGQFTNAYTCGSRMCKSLNVKFRQKRCCVSHQLNKCGTDRPCEIDCSVGRPCVTCILELWLRTRDRPNGGRFCRRGCLRRRRRIRDRLSANMFFFDPITKQHWAGSTTKVEEQNDIHCEHTKAIVTSELTW